MLISTFLIIVLLIGLIVKILDPSIDRLSTGEIVLWYTSPNTNERNLVYLWKI